MTLRSRITDRFPILFAMREAVGIGLGAIRAYKMRASLTILGVVMGIMTVTGMSAIVAGLNASMAKQIESLGSSVLMIRPFQPGENIPEDEWRKRRGLSEVEVEALAALPLIRAVAPMELAGVDLIKYGNQRLKDATTLCWSTSESPPWRISTASAGNVKSLRSFSWRAFSISSWTGVRCL